MKTPLFHPHLHLEKSEGWVDKNDVNRVTSNGLREMRVNRCLYQKFKIQNISPSIAVKNRSYVNPTTYPQFTDTTLNPHFTLILPS